jgi:hypothetical protein
MGKINRINGYISDKHICMGTIFTKEGRDTKNICHRVTQTRKIICALNGVW